MKKNKVLSLYQFGSLYKTPEFIFLTGVIICGILAGSFTAMHITDSSGQYIDKLSDYILATAGREASIHQILWNLFCDFAYLGVLLLCAAVISNAYLTGILTAGKGFMLAFSICALLVRKGSEGLVFSLFYAALPGILILPAILHLAAIGLITAGKGRGNRVRKMSSYKREILISVFLVLVANIVRGCCIYFMNL